MSVGFGRQIPVESMVRWKPNALARALALGYRIRQAVETLEVASFSEAARTVKVSPQRVSRLVGMTLLPREVQEAILGGSALRPATMAPSSNDPREAIYKPRHPLPGRTGCLTASPPERVVAALSPARSPASDSPLCSDSGLGIRFRSPAQEVTRCLPST